MVRNINYKERGGGNRKRGLMRGEMVDNYIGRGEGGPPPLPRWLGMSDRVSNREDNVGKQLFQPNIRDIIMTCTLTVVLSQIKFSGLR